MREIPFSKAVWLLPIAYTIHDLEEWLFQPNWSAQVPFQPEVQTVAFRFAVAAIILASWIIALAAFRSTRGSIAAHVAAAAAGILFLNAFFPHLLAAAWVWGYAPGVVTAVLLNLWVGPLVLHSAISHDMVTVRGAALSTAVACAVLPPILALLFWVGRALPH